MKIAIVEDHLMTREVVRKVCNLFLDLDVVVESSTGLDAVERIINTLPELVVLDLGLPDIDGLLDETARCWAPR